MEWQQLPDRLSAVRLPSIAATVATAAIVATITVAAATRSQPATTTAATIAATTIAATTTAAAALAATTIAATTAAAAALPTTTLALVATSRTPTGDAVALPAEAALATGRVCKHLRPHQHTGAGCGGAHPECGLLPGRATHHRGWLRPLLLRAQ